MDFIINIHSCSVWKMQGNKLQGERDQTKKEKSSRDADEERLERKNKDFLWVSLCQDKTYILACHLSHKNLHEKPHDNETLHLLKKWIFMYISHRKGLIILLPQWTQRTVHEPCYLSRVSAYLSPMFTPYTFFINISNLVSEPNDSVFCQANIPLTAV